MPPSPEMARNTRRAAELVHRWRQNDIEGVAALIREAEMAGEHLDNVVCSLLYVCGHLVNAAADGRADEYLEQLRGASLVAEALSGGDDG